MKLQMTALAILLSSVVTANAGNGWNFFGITVPYHNDPCWEMFAEPLYQDQCNPKDGNNNLIKSPVTYTPVAKPPKDDNPKEDDNDSDTDGGDDVTDPGDHNGGDTSDDSDSNGDNSSDDSNGDNSDDRGDKKDKKRDRK
jgi:hypothetical protein